MSIPCPDTRNSWFFDLNFCSAFSTLPRTTMSLHASHSSPRPHLSDTWPELPHYPPAELPYESYPPFYAPCMSIFSSHYTDSAPEVTNPFIFAETKHDFRAPSIDARRFRAHLYRYGYKRRSAKHVRTSLTEVRAPILVQNRDESGCEANASFLTGTLILPKGYSYALSP